MRKQVPAKIANAASRRYCECCQRLALVRRFAVVSRLAGGGHVGIKRSRASLRLPEHPGLLVGLLRFLRLAHFVIHHAEMVPDARIIGQASHSNFEARCGFLELALPHELQPGPHIAATVIFRRLSKVRTTLALKLMVMTGMVLALARRRRYSLRMVMTCVVLARTRRGHRNRRKERRIPENSVRAERWNGIQPTSAWWRVPEHRGLLVGLLRFFCLAHFVVRHAQIVLDTSVTGQVLLHGEFEPGCGFLELALLHELQPRLHILAAVIWLGLRCLAKVRTTLALKRVVMTCMLLARTDPGRHTRRAGRPRPGHNAPAEHEIGLLEVGQGPIKGGFIERRVIGITERAAAVQERLHGERDGKNSESSVADFLWSGSHGALL